MKIKYIIVTSVIKGLIVFHYKKPDKQYYITIHA